MMRLFIFWEERGIRDRSFGFFVKRLRGSGSNICFDLDDVVSLSLLYRLSKLITRDKFTLRLQHIALVIF